MTISVIIPAINERPNIASAVDRAWQCGAGEVLVVDGGSRDGTRELAQALPCTLIDAPSGRAVQQNLGADQASGDVLLFLHADNWLAPGSADQIRQALRNPGVHHGCFRQRIEASDLGYRLLEWGNAKRAAWWGIAYGDQALFVRRETFFAAGRFPQQPLLEDLLLCERLRQYGWPVVLPGPLHVSARRWQSRGIFRQTLRNWSILARHAGGESPTSLAALYRRHDAS